MTTHVTSLFGVMLQFNNNNSIVQSLQQTLNPLKYLALSMDMD